MSAPLGKIVQTALSTHTATVIFIHGLGDSGHGWAPVAKELAKILPHVKFILPHAPAQPVTLNFGMEMPSWYDIKSLDKIDDTEDEAGILQSVARINQLIGDEVNNNIPAHRVAVAGFSQGAAVSLLTGLTSERKLGAIAALSGYLPLSTKVFSMASDANKQTPIFMGHGDEDEVVRFQYGQGSSEALKAKGYTVAFHKYPHMAHSCCNDEIRDLAMFLASALPNN
ncbi:hypothetical protein H4R34_005262 [Dimargaris verticillata]|uniref:Acyl-protein thioesterase 1 n=1 Tax=Dimargaris verticillata TaxID=2761393 RepID=A0A9W8AWT7_9FUNG|nr:hypothetical protein H4R34_005262 [Dimargaris verticillata]